jgi:hypothetical protein
MNRALLFLITLFLFSFSQSKAQFLASFFALQHNESIELSITIAGGNTCNGITILRSADGIIFTPIGGIAGVCGSSTEDVFYSFTDPDPLPNRLNYYRLDLITLGYTSIINIHFLDFGKQELLFYPNPVLDKASVYLKASVSDVSSYSIVDRFGIVLKKVEGIRGDYFEVERGNWAAGLYYLEVQTGNRKKLTWPFMVE